MPEATAQKKFSCPACGGEAQWNPAKQALICPYCGATSPAQVELTATGEVAPQYGQMSACCAGFHCASPPQAGQENFF